MDIATQIGFLAAIVSGAIAMWLVMKNRLVTVAEGAVNAATTSLQVELAQANERNRSFGHELESAKHDGAEAFKRAESLRGLLDEVKDGQSRLTERSSRVPILEAELLILKENLAVSINNARELSISEAQKIQSIASSKEHFEDLQTSFDALQRRNNEATVLLREETERRASLEEQATRLPGLVTEVSGLMGKLSVSMDEARELASSEAQKIQSIASSKEQLDALQASYSGLQRQHNEAASLLREAVERKAALEEQATRLPVLKAEVSMLTEKLAVSMDEARELSSSEAQKIQFIASSKEQLDALQASFAVLHRQHNEATAKLGC